MSDTPRTDAELERVNKMIRIGLEYADMAEVYAWAFARQLERENAELKELVAQMKEALKAAAETIHFLECERGHNFGDLLHDDLLPALEAAERMKKK